MSNLRSDARDFAKTLPDKQAQAKTLIERLCYQVDAVEDCWHSASREAEHFRKTADLFAWACDQGCIVQRNSTLGQPRWGCLDIDAKLIGSGWSPADAIEQAKRNVSQ